MTFRGAGSGGLGLPAAGSGVGYPNVPGRGGAGGASSTTAGGMPAFPALSGRPMVGQGAAGGAPGFMGIGRGVGAGLGSFGINGMGYGSHAPPSSQAEASLDPSDFPALGGGAGGGLGSAAAVGAGNGVSGASQPSYASHVNTPSVSSTANGPSSAALSMLGAGAGAGGRSDFTADDFPALAEGLGADATREAREQASAAAALNALARMPGGKPPSEADKRDYATKLGGAQNAFPGSAHLMNGIASTSQQQQSLVQAQAHAAAQSTASIFRSGPTSNMAGVAGPDGSQMPSSAGTQGGMAGMVPQTAAQQVLYSPADRFGLLGLLQIIKHSDPDSTKLAMGMDLAQLGLDMGSANNLYSTFMTPWSDASQVAAANVEPEYHLPSCYNVSPPLISNKINMFHDESLLWIFYNQPRDVVQELAAAELYRRNWRYHKELQTWLTKRPGVDPHEKNNSFEKGQYIFFDTKEWRKIPRDYTLVYAALEAKPSLSNPTLLQQALSTIPAPAHPQSTSAGGQQPPSTGQQPQQVPGRTASAQGGGGQPRVPSGVGA